MRAAERRAWRMKRGVASYAHDKAWLARWALLTTVCLALLCQSAGLMQRLYFNLAFVDALKHQPTSSLLFPSAKPSEFLRSTPAQRLTTSLRAEWFASAADHDLGRLALLEGDAHSAAQYLSRAVEVAAPNAMTYWHFGVALWHEGEPDAAIQAWQQAGAMPYFWQRGLLWWRQKRWAEAEAALRLAASLAPTHSMALNDLGQFYWEQGQTEAAQQYLRQAVAHESSPYERYLLRGKLAQLAGQFDEAEMALRAAALQQPQRPEPYGRLALLQWQRQRLPQALDTLADGLSRVAHPAGLYILRGQILNAQAQWLAADQAYQQALQLEPRNVSAWRGRAQNALDGGRPDEATNFLRRALQLNPQDSELRNWLAVLMAKMDARH